MEVREVRNITFVVEEEEQEEDLLSFANIEKIPDQLLPPEALKPYVLVIGITSAPESREKRDTLRKNSWISKIRNKDSILYRFVIGNTKGSTTRSQALIDEMKENSDILYLPYFEEDPRNLTFKVLTFYQWVSFHNKYDGFSFNWSMRVTDDSWWNFDLAFPELETLRPRRLLWSKFPRNARVPRDPKNPSYDPDYDAELYPMFPARAGYVISSDLVVWLSRQWEGGWLWPYNDDVPAVALYLGTINPEKKNDIRWFVLESSLEQCYNAKTEVVLVHPLTAKGLAQREVDWMTCKRPCGCGAVAPLITD
eukprot:TRINITY_DN4757_c0_g1_i4.p1 TRINITY_DN4757_c0_g1~~TRINITY_DN4757_c0_g1_i4.p1  ORF type:complete len:360 (-),score=59.44 TRINITY_DN4757_c0_g1_i4:51-977(-)